MIPEKTESAVTIHVTVNIHTSKELGILYTFGNAWIHSLIGVFDVVEGHLICMVSVIIMGENSDGQNSADYCCRELHGSKL